MNLSLKRVELKEGAFKMPNNLEYMIDKSGMMRKDVAERMGIRPETVSRHVNGGLQFSIAQAEQYAMILGCKPQDILFAQSAVPLFGTLDDDIVTPCDPTEGEVSYFVPFPVEEDRVFVKAAHTKPNKKWANDRLYTFNSGCIKKQTVDETSYMKLCIFKVKDNKQLRFGVVYPEPGGTFAIGFNGDSHTNSEQGAAPTLIHTEIKRGLDLRWCTPILTCLMQPEMIGVVQKDH